jgi:hypothetical protein
LTGVDFRNDCCLPGRHERASPLSLVEALLWILPEISPKGISGDRDHAALQLGFYLASWGMYGGSSFLLQYDYTVIGALSSGRLNRASRLYEKRILILVRGG